ncbi:hypothetical protein CRG98_005987 [Punica granatum]|uniref:Uncharacterized protein n=1 Tax=Punica granatum TaxID=22663 RepID=A0A2I0KZ40_PUNGR|nr:hypothetical protein CRG98_005987 [Punica granatum]
MAMTSKGMLEYIRQVLQQATTRTWSLPVATSDSSWVVTAKIKKVGMTQRRTIRCCRRSSYPCSRQRNRNFSSSRYSPLGPLCPFIPAQSSS